LDRWGAWPLIPLGFACIIAGQVAILVAGQAYEVVAIVIGGCFICAGVGLTSSPSQVTGLSSLEPDLYPHGVSIVSAFIQIAGCLAPTLYVGVMNGMQDAALAGGAPMQAAVAQGMGAGMAVALAISFTALTLSLIYTLVIQRKH
jgi:DHA2 family lincomycin resistance protein-like MFS transporter